jgi:hypothetical protein
MTPWDGMNRRKFPRVYYPCLIVLKYAEGEQESILTHTENIGVGGISAIVKKNLKIFSPVDLELDVLDLGGHIKCQGRVVWSIRRKEDDSKKPMFYDVGIEFSSLSSEDLGRIEDIVKRIAKQGGIVPETPRRKN